jgi:hypothetical protein
MMIRSQLHTPCSSTRTAGLGLQPAGRDFSTAKRKSQAPGPDLARRAPKLSLALPETLATNANLLFIPSLAKPIDTDSMSTHK